MPDFSSNLRRLRKKAGFSQDAPAESSACRFADSLPGRKSPLRRMSGRVEGGSVFLVHGSFPVCVGSGAPALLRAETPAPPSAGRRIVTAFCA